MVTGVQAPCWPMSSVHVDQRWGFVLTGVRGVFPSVSDVHPVCLCTLWRQVVCSENVPLVQWRQTYVMIVCSLQTCATGQVLHALARLLRVKCDVINLFSLLSSDNIVNANFQLTADTNVSAGRTWFPLHGALRTLYSGTKGRRERWA